MSATTKAILGVVFIVLMFAVPAVLYFAVALPGEVQYQRKFGGQISITIDQPTFSGMSTNLMKVWKSMNQSFPDNHNDIYGSPFYWDQTPDNSLASEDAYFRTEIGRLNNYTTQYNAYIQAGTKTVTGLPITDWLDKTVANSRAELQRNGGLDWALHGAWLLRYAPITYWFGFIAAPIFVGFLAAALVMFYLASKPTNND